MKIPKQIESRKGTMMNLAGHLNQLGDIHES
mgnify:CR=1 FL=1|jgi:hypothetical protein